MAVGDSMILGSDVNHRIQKMDALERQVAFLEAEKADLHRIARGWKLIAEEQRKVIDQLKAELHRVDL